MGFFIFLLLAVEFQFSSPFFLCPLLLNNENQTLNTISPSHHHRPALILRLDPHVF